MARAPSPTPANTRALSADEWARIDEIRGALAARYQPATPMHAIVVGADPGRRRAVLDDIALALPRCRPVGVTPWQLGHVRMDGAGGLVWLDVDATGAHRASLLIRAIRDADPCPLLLVAVSHGASPLALETLDRCAVDYIADHDSLRAALIDGARAFAAVRLHKLEAAYRRACADEIRRALSPEAARVAGYAAPPMVVRPLDEVIRAHARAALHTSGGNRRAAAAMLGISRSRLYRLLHPCDEGERDARPAGVRRDPGDEESATECLDSRHQGACRPARAAATEPTCDRVDDATPSDPESESP